MFRLCYWFDQKTGIVCSTVVSILLKIRFGHARISVPKIGIPMSKAACINTDATCTIFNIYLLFIFFKLTYTVKNITVKIK